MEDYLAIGDLLEDHIKARMAGSPVRQLTALADIEDVPLRGHLICIAYAGETAISSSIDTATITQRWLTVVSVQTAAKALTADERAKAGPLLWRLSKAVQGMQFRGFKPLARVNPPAPLVREGFAHFSLAWETSFMLAGDCLPDRRRGVFLRDMPGPMTFDVLIAVLDRLKSDPGLTAFYSSHYPGIEPNYSISGSLNPANREYPYLAAAPVSGHRPRKKNEAVTQKISLMFGVTEDAVTDGVSIGLERVTAVQELVFKALDPQPLCESPRVVWLSDALTVNDAGLQHPHYEAEFIFDVTIYPS